MDRGENTVRHHLRRTVRQCVTTRPRHKLSDSPCANGRIGFDQCPLVLTFSNGLAYFCSTAFFASSRAFSVRASSSWAPANSLFMEANLCASAMARSCAEERTSPTPCPVCHFCRMPATAKLLASEASWSVAALFSSFSISSRRSSIFLASSLIVGCRSSDGGNSHSI